MTDYHVPPQDEPGETLNPIPALTEDEYVAEVLRSALSPDALSLHRRDGLLLGALGLATEAGEVANLVKQHCFDGHPLERAGLLDELGEVLRSHTWLCHVLEISLGAVMLGNITKLRARSPGGVEPQHSKPRKE